MRFSTSAPFIALTALAASYAFPKRELNFTTCNEAILLLSEPSRRAVPDRRALAASPAAASTDGQPGNGCHGLTHPYHRRFSRLHGRLAPPNVPSIPPRQRPMLAANLLSNLSPRSCHSHPERRAVFFGPTVRLLWRYYWYYGASEATWTPEPSPWARVDASDRPWQPSCCTPQSGGIGERCRSHVTGRH